MDALERERAQAEDSLRIFAFLWAVATLFHQASYKLWALTPPDLLLSVAALFAVLRPGSLARFTFFLLAQLWAIYEKLPEVANHWLLTGFMNLSMLVALGVGLLRARGGRIDRARLYQDFAPALRLELVILYFWSTFHKLNADYFDPQVSCAALLSDALSSRLSFLPTGSLMQYAAIFGSLLIEVAIPVFLCVPRLRVVGIVIGALFHIVLAISPYPPARVYNFSAMLFASYFLFAPKNLPELLKRFWLGSAFRRLWLAAPVAVQRAPAWLFALFVWLLGCAALFRDRDPLWERLLIDGPNALWVMYAAALLAVFLMALRCGPWRQLGAGPLLGVRHPAIAALPFVVFLNGLSPYLGWKTETSFAMFSNLRTEAGATNHFLIRRPLRLCGYQEDLVTIVATQDPELQWYVDTGHVMTWFEFRDYAGRQKRLSVTYARRGKPPRTIERVADDKQLRRPPGWLRKLLWFRPVKIQGLVDCKH